MIRNPPANVYSAAPEVSWGLFCCALFSWRSNTSRNTFPNSLSPYLLYKSRVFLGFSLLARNTISNSASTSEEASSGRRIVGGLAMDQRILVGVREAAAMLGISPRMVHELVRTGELPSVRIGARRLFRPETLKAWAAEREKRTIANEPRNSRGISASV